MLFAKLNSNIRRLGMYALVAVLAFSAGFATLAHATNPITFYACRDVGKKTLYNVVTGPSLPLTCIKGDEAVQWDQVGPMGPQGPKGDTGPAGATGPQGVQGLKGDTGPIGPQGAKGDKGDTGLTGPQGPQGVQGPKGDKGDIGDVGPMGPQGPAGPSGTGGPSCDLEWRTKDALDALSEATYGGNLSSFQVASECFIDTDGDKLSDHDEERLGTDSLDPDTDDDGIYDGVEVHVPCRFYRNGSLIQNVYSSPISADPDRDGFTDADECFLYFSDPWFWNSSSASPYTDTDGDGLANNAEGWYGGNVLEADPDEDGFSDRIEVGAGTNPYDANSHP